MIFPLRFCSGRWAETPDGETWSLDLGGWKNKYHCKMTWKVFELLSTFKMNFFASFTVLWDKQLQLSCSMQNNLKCLQTEQQVLPPCCQFIQAGLDLWSRGWHIAHLVYYTIDQTVLQCLTLANTKDLYSLVMLRLSYSQHKLFHFTVFAFHYRGTIVTVNPHPSPGLVFFLVFLYDISKNPLLKWYISHLKQFMFTKKRKCAYCRVRLP